MIGVDRYNEPSALSWHIAAHVTHTLANPLPRFHYLQLSCVLRRTVDIRIRSVAHGISSLHARDSTLPCVSQ